MLREGKSVWAGKTAVVAMGDLLTLGAFSMVPPITESLVGAFSTEREALAVCKEMQPDLLYVTEQLGQGYGIPSSQQGQGGQSQHSGVAVPPSGEPRGGEGSH